MIKRVTCPSPSFHHDLTLHAVKKEQCGNDGRPRSRFGSIGKTFQTPMLLRDLVLSVFVGIKGVLGWFSAYISSSFCTSVQLYVEDVKLY